LPPIVFSRYLDSTVNTPIIGITPFIFNAHSDVVRSISGMEGDYDYCRCLSSSPDEHTRLPKTLPGKHRTNRSDGSLRLIKYLLDAILAKCEPYSRLIESAVPDAQQVFFISPLASDGFFLIVATGNYSNVIEHLL
jgi:hypothetical protein